MKKEIGHGNFLPWIEAEFGMSEDAAQRMMGVARKLGGQIPHDAVFAPTVLYPLAAPSTPEPVRQQIIERAQQSEAATAADIDVGLAEQIEAADGMVMARKANRTALVRALETATVEFISENGGGPG